MNDSPPGQSKSTSIVLPGVLLIAGQVAACAVAWVTMSGTSALVFVAGACMVTTVGFIVWLASKERDRGDAAATELWRLRDELELLKARLGEQRIIRESMSTGMIALDLEQRILSVNRAAERLFGIDEDIAKGQLLRYVLQEPDFNKFVAQSLGSNKPASLEFALVGRSGSTIQALGEPLLNGENKPIGLLVLVNDVTRLRKLEDLRSDFAANVSHELRTPITNIKGYVETLLDVGVENKEQSQKFLGIIHRNTERLAFIIEDLLALARLEQPDAKGTLQRQPTLVRHIIDSVIAHFEKETAERSIRIETSIPADLTATVNSQLIEQALGNLLSNAIKYSPARTRVTLAAKRNAEGEIELSVSDRGPGIAKEHLPRLFERFYRVDRARSREIGGTGLGLAIVKHIALVHGGRAEVESELGKGSTFRIVVPAAIA